MGAQGFGDVDDALSRGGGHFAVGAAFAKDEPDTGAMNGGVAADCPGELRDFERAAGEFVIEKRANLVEEVFEALGGEHGINVAGDGGLHLVEIVIGQRAGDHQLD